MGRVWLFRLGAAVLPVLPYALTRPLALVAGTLAWRCAARTRRQVERNLRHVPALASTTARLHCATRGVFQQAALNYLDSFCSGKYSREAVLREWRLEGEECLVAAQAKGRGIVLLTGHFGSFERAAVRLSMLVGEVLTPVEHVQPEALFELFLRLRTDHGLRVLPADRRETLRAMLDTLRNNGVIMIVNDRYVTGSYLETPFFGELAKLPTAGINLALRTGAAVVAIFPVSEPGGIRRGVFVPLDLDELVTLGTRSPGDLGERSGEVRPAVATARALSADATRRALERFVSVLERMIAEHPEQWVAAMSPVWEA